MTKTVMKPTSLAAAAAPTLATIGCGRAVVLLMVIVVIILSPLSSSLTTTVFQVEAFSMNAPPTTTQIQSTLLLSRNANKELDTTTAARPPVLLTMLRSSSSSSQDDEEWVNDDQLQKQDHDHDQDRRVFTSGFLGSLLLGGATSAAASSNGRAVAPVFAATANSNGLLADLPMVRLKLPRGGFGREYVALKLQVQGQGPFEFMVDSGLTTELITPHLQNILGLNTNNKSRLSALAAGGSTNSNPLVELEGVELCCGKFPTNKGGGTLPLPPLNAVITDFPQEHIDPAHDPVEGMIGMELLEMFDVDLDFPNNRIRFWKPGTADTTGLIEIPAVVINESLLIGIRVTCEDKSGGGARQPFLGFLDCGSTFSCVNWKAANLLRLPPKSDPVYQKGPAVAALGIDGRPLTLPTTKTRLDFVGNAVMDSSTGRPTGFEPPPKNWKAWDPVQLAVGDIPVFSEILGDGRTPYQGPAALIGLDILSQRRVILEAGTGRTRVRKVAVSPS
mmetsp:Transcript_23183/g.54980  ORF Transcript_23183/g.54980 Transcript_23183/m.54980 type:complete len:504 (+) Transcript_23183:201-1712(+)|eukprot:CAMPEP_0113440260 /NCGR_PEP_ID=MMETSP0014_2-20120614/466_1 /TAXON_ID=2857 /ORGANISM="Nitzschia sp." /LENGTH=503 /DNA_ID=CAMNT_0000331049 /DNA_START=160 /DNA_END=1671 /DNA_ORIENTATION=+ /assembly_acc=CAM_ASM_000159